jgi:hypothetical protein
MSRDAFCPCCGELLVQRYVEGQERQVCSRCGRIHYRNAKPCACALVIRDRRVLLVRRAIEPFYSIVKICQVWEMEAGGSSRETEAFSKKAKRGYAVWHSRVLSLRRAAHRGDLSRSVALNHVRRYATWVVIISKRATSHRARLGTRTRLGRQALRATLEGQGDWRRSRPPGPGPCLDKGAFLC